MFTEFSAAARAVFTLAEQECRNASHYYLGTEHLLLAMAIAPPPDVADYFRSAGIEAWQVKRALRNTLDQPSERNWEGIIVTPRVQRITAMACEGKKQALVQPIDVLNAILADGGGVAARVWRSLLPQTADRRL
ncbi:MAG: hypothetical protein M3Z37_01115 [Candidatus Eremiobacteraeota bacterium]|nr:hypothetical protein [Candidatus Eremiobacteraeota bacterium]